MRRARTFGVILEIVGAILVIVAMLLKLPVWLAGIGLFMMAAAFIVVCLGYEKFISKHRFQWIGGFRIDIFSTSEEQIRRVRKELDKVGKL